MHVPRNLRLQECYTSQACVLRHRGAQLILAYSWARPAILVADKGKRGMFLFLLFLHFYSCSSFFLVPLCHLFYYIFCLFSPFLWKTSQNDTQEVDVSLNPNTSNQSIYSILDFNRDIWAFADLGFRN